MEYHPQPSSPWTMMIYGPISFINTKSPKYHISYESTYTHIYQRATIDEQYIICVIVCDSSNILFSHITIWSPIIMAWMNYCKYFGFNIYLKVKYVNCNIIIEKERERMREPTYIYIYVLSSFHFLFSFHSIAWLPYIDLLYASTNVLYDDNARLINRSFKKIYKRSVLAKISQEYYWQWALWNKRINVNRIM